MYIHVTGDQLTMYVHTCYTSWPPLVHTGDHPRCQFHQHQCTTLRYKNQHKIWAVSLRLTYISWKHLIVEFNNEMFSFCHFLLVRQRCHHSMRCCCVLGPESVGDLTAALLLAQLLFTCFSSLLLFLSAISLCPRFLESFSFDDAVLQSGKRW